ncbi:MAG: hypothetical protein K6G92_10890 [Bacteroidaceae bacterium]|nr:hypothetical protein [Bacteroidaceae bacterium]
MNQTLTLNGDFFYDLSIVAEDEGLLKRVMRYVKKLAKEKQADPTLMTEEEFFAKLDRAEEQFKRGEGIRFTDRDEMNAWLNSL